LLRKLSKFITQTGLYCSKQLETTFHQFCEKPLHITFNVGHTDLFFKKLIIIGNVFYCRCEIINYNKMLESGFMDKLLQFPYLPAALHAAQSANI